MTGEPNGKATRGTASGVLRPEELDAAIFELEGVLTDTAEAHFRAWKETFDPFLERRADREETPFEPFTRNDYRRHVHGKPRYEGARDFLRARGIELPFGAPGDPAGPDSVCALGNRKDERYRAVLESGGLPILPGSAELVRRLRSAGVRTAVVTGSRHGRQVLEASGLEELFDAVVDAAEFADDPTLTGRPAPDLLLQAAGRLDASPDRSAVVENSAPGVEAGRRGDFGVVIGVARDREGEEALERAGADLVVRDLGRVPVSSGLGRQASRDRTDEEAPAPEG
ncbi:MAG: HAD-IA family hydrolase [Candidatus Palauibacterales bacterium]|nr:HAD-IA family hydrolase [Candidatus Palauibacterales bacterium]